MTSLGTASPTCAHCGSSDKDRLYLKEDHCHCCEGCLLDRCIGQKPTLDLAGLYSGFVEALVRTLDMRELETGLHSRRSACHTLVLARRIITDAEELRQIYWGALLHDIGKIGIPEHILLKTDALTNDEWLTMRTHVELGYSIVSQLPGLERAAAVVRSHEERFDGTGYPHGLKGEEISVGSRLFAVIDTLDAMTSDRSYRRGLEFEKAKEEILKMSGSQFDPVAVDLFLAEEKVLRDMVALKCGQPQSV
ncbi:response regulator [Dechloromonas denitrificans]|uniref:Response regulator n=1 Tax=Dechloromonas denitrificans TaxID=281362 RepID=A0A133XNJ8_9RHOO|nr:response regulator [Dechloromonas denitrificans]